MNTFFICSESLYIYDYEIYTCEGFTGIDLVDVREFGRFGLVQQLRTNTTLTKLPIGIVLKTDV